MKFAYIALIAAVSAAEEVLSATDGAGMIPLGGNCLSTGDGTGCIAEHKCAVIPTCDAACETAADEKQAAEIAAEATRQAALTDDERNAELLAAEEARKVLADKETAESKALYDTFKALSAEEQAAFTLKAEAEAAALKVEQDRVMGLVKSSLERCVAVATCDEEGYTCGAMQLGATLVSAVAIMNLM